MSDDENSPSEKLDLRGYQCPLPVLKTRNHLRKLSEGQSVLVLTDDPMAGLDIPHFCNEYGQELMRHDSGDGDNNSFLIVRRGEKL